MKIALVGNPNCGKTTLFNALTGSKHRVGNWAGVTVDCEYAPWLNHQLIDLPGLYSLTVTDAKQSIDELIAIRALEQQGIDAIINVVDASNIERNLFLSAQLLGLKLPMVVVLNMIDVATQRGKHIDEKKLAQLLGCPVVKVCAKDKVGTADLSAAFRDKRFLQPELKLHYGAMENAIDSLMESGLSRFESIRALEGDVNFTKALQDAAIIEKDTDIQIATHRYHWIENIVKTCQNVTETRGISLTQRIDKIVLNRYLGFPCFLLAMYGLFVFAINLGGLFKDFVEILSEAIFVDGLSELLIALHTPDWLVALLSSGVGVGIATTLTFIPIIGAMYIALAFLEDSGYMARAAFVVDRAMRLLGLPGKSFVPLIVGFGCNVPSIMAARTLDKERDRILTILMSPFMSCGARLAIYTVFVSAFFEEGGHNVIFSLYLVGIIMAIFTGVLLKNTLLKGQTSEWVVELPTYHMPKLSTLLRHAWHRVKKFVINAGTMIVPLCLIIGALNSINTSFEYKQPSEDSVLSIIGKKVTPIFTPFGIEEDNWPASVGLLTGVMAKEVVVGTLNTLYTTHAAQGDINSELPRDEFKFTDKIIEAFASLPENLTKLSKGFLNPIKASSDTEELSSTAFGEMSKRFDGKQGAFAYLLFVLLYFPCVSATAAMAKELANKWALFSVCWTTYTAYAVAVIFYQMATFYSHPITSCLWVLGMILTGVGFWLGLIQLSKARPKMVPTRLVVN